MTADISWLGEFGLDVQFGYLGKDVRAPRHHHPQVVLNESGSSVLRTLREELGRCEGFTFSVAFVSPRAVALLKQELVEFSGRGTIITSDYLSFNSPEAFAELLNLVPLGIDVRVHSSAQFHPKGYIFEHAHGVTAMVGSSNLTENALVKNHEWNLKVSATAESDLAAQLATLVEREIESSAPLNQAWIDDYAMRFVPPEPRPARVMQELSSAFDAKVEVLPNLMQRDALRELSKVREEGAPRAIVISATGTGKTMLSALDVRAFAARRMLFIAHREQILDRTMREYRRVLGGPASDYGKISGSAKQTDRRYVFATVQTLSQPAVLHSFDPTEFDYIVIDEAHRAGAVSHRSVMGYFTPEFLLGMTATPERTDGFNVFELFDYVVPYEIRLTHALEAEMLSPFHYYGVADIQFENGHTTSEASELGELASTDRVKHLIWALETYGQAGISPRGLIFCSRREEARRLSDLLNAQTFRGTVLRTVSLTGADSVSYREACVERLESGELDYILTVDVFNEGVDIPSVNQVVMLRQTQSAIVFVQQLGRGLRKAPGKESLVVIDFIGNYANNYLIPIALFGDESLNKESLRKNLIAAEEAGVLAGLSSVRFDKISQRRVLASIGQTSLDSMPRLKNAMESMRNRVGRIPRLADFYRFESVDPVILGTKLGSFPELAEALLRIDPGLQSEERRWLRILSHEVLTAKRPHEFVVLGRLLKAGVASEPDLEGALAERGITVESRILSGLVDTFTLDNFEVRMVNRYGAPIASRHNGEVVLGPDFMHSYRESGAFSEAVDDLVSTGLQLAVARYATGAPFVVGAQYSRKEVTRQLGWPRAWTSTLYGYKADVESGEAPLFVTLHKSEEVSASTAYEDALIDRSSMVWFSKSNRTLLSPDVRAIVGGAVRLSVFVKKDDAEGTDFYFLGHAVVESAVETSMANGKGALIPVVKMVLRFPSPIDGALFDYFHPVVTA